MGSRGTTRGAVRPRSAVGAAAVIVALAAVASPTSAGPRPRGATAGGEPPPNVVLVLADDMGAGELGCYGHPLHATPRIDALAREGVRFRTCWATPMATPSRIELLTGQYGFRTGYFNQIHRPFTPEPGSPLYDLGTKLTIADLLTSKGYATALAGKWQLPGELPTLVRDAGFGTYRIWSWKHHLPPGVHHTGAFRADRKGIPSRFWNPGVLEDGAYVPTAGEAYGPDLYADFAVDFIDAHRQEPFFLLYAMTLPHSPWLPTPVPGDPGARTAGSLKDSVEYMDHLVGRVLDALDAAGLRDRTVVVFTSDGGTQDGGKGYLTEAGVRVPLIVRDPRAAERGTVRDELVDLTDLFPTLGELAGARAPGDHAVDGRSLLPVLRGPGPATAHRDWIFSYLWDDRMIRERDWLLTADGRLLHCAGGPGDGECREESSVFSAEVRREVLERLEGRLEALPGPSRDQGLRWPSERQRQRKRESEVGIFGR